jgi:acyl-CoA thioester hydrolase
VRWRARVRYAECDRFGIAHHSSYVPWFENGRVELLRQLGWDYDEVEAQGLAYPLSELGVRYDAPAACDELITVHCGLLAVDRLRLTFAARVHGEDGRRIARFFSIHALVNREMKVQQIPADFREFAEARLVGADYLGKRFGPPGRSGR